MNIYDLPSRVSFIHTTERLLIPMEDIRYKAYLNAYIDFSSGLPRVVDVRIEAAPGHDIEPPGIRKEKEFDFFVPSKHRERERASTNIQEQLYALEQAAADNYEGPKDMFNHICDDWEREASTPPGEIPLLDHGYIKLVETWGSDERIIEAARMSTDGAFRGWGPKYETVPSRLPSGGVSMKEVPGDEKLLAYLYKNNHSTPFEMAGAIIEVQAPIFVFREWHRHRTQSYNELSARYTPLPDLYYTPTVKRCMLNSAVNKQAGRAQGADELTEDTAALFVKCLKENYIECESFYQHWLKSGVPKELARCIMPVGHYSRMRASANLRNWLGFLTLRQAPNAQWEIRQYADALNSILVERFPRTMELFNDAR